MEALPIGGAGVEIEPARSADAEVADARLAAARAEPEICHLISVPSPATGTDRLRAFVVSRRAPIIPAAAQGNEKCGPPRGSG